MIDPIPNPNRVAPEHPRTVDDLVQARIDGRLSRRGLIARAAALGFGAPVIATMLHATSDMVRGVPTASAQGAVVELTGPTAPEGEKQAGGTIIAGTNQEPDSLHPWISQTVTGADVYTAVVEGLMGYDATQQLVPKLATEYSISDDGKTFTFTLREGVKFHNGDTFTADDVINSWKMIVNPEFGAFNLSGWDKIADVTAEGNVVTMTLTEVFAPFLSYVAGSTPLAPSSEMAKGPDAFKQEYGRAPVGTGPMTFGEWKAKEQIVLNRFPDYWGEPTVIDTFIYRIVPDDNTMLVQLRTGEIDLIGSASTVSASRVDEALGFENVVVFQHPTLAWQHIDLKHIDFLRMTKVRQALDFATPSKDIIEKLLKGRAVPSVADQAPGSWAWDGSIEPRPYDLEQAKALLAEAGLAPGADGTLEGKVPTSDPQVGDGEVKPFAIELWFVSGEADNERIMQVVAQSWSQLGIKTEVKNQDISTIWGPEGYQFTDAMTGCLYSWFNGNDPTNRFYWHSSQIPDSPTGSGGNLPAYFHPYNFQEEIDRLTDAGDLETDQEKRKAIYFEIQKLLHEEVPVIFIYWNVAFPAARTTIGGYQPNPFTYLTWNVNQWYTTV